jgi:ribulose-bisphosphate carboxylase large chain
MSYVDLKYEPSKDDLVCLFRIEPSKGVSIKQAAEDVAAESSIGTWTEICTMSPKIQSMGAKVFEIKGSMVKVAYPLELFELGNMSQVLSSVAGNIFGMKALKNLRLEDIDWPDKMINSFKGPYYGIHGIRKLLKVKDRPLIGTIIKPKLGLDEVGHAKVAYEAWAGGLDIVKDDENLTSQPFNNFSKRIVETLKLRDKAEQETGEKKMYMANITSDVDTMLERANFIKECGGEYAMVDVLTVGWSALQTLRKANEDLKLVLHAHRAGHATFTRSKKHGISMIVIGDITRLIGLDQLHIGTVVGKMRGAKTEVLNTEEEIEETKVIEHSHCLAEDWLDIKPVFAVCSGGLYPGTIPYLTRVLGKDIIIQAGGGVHGHRGGTRAGAMATRQAVDAVMEGISLPEYAKSHKELGVAIRQWGYVK